LVVDLIERETRLGHRAEAAAAFDRASLRFASNRNALQQLASPRLAVRGGSARAQDLAAPAQARSGNEVVIIGLGESQFQAG
jgi:hypothetical protein